MAEERWTGLITTLKKGVEVDRIDCWKAINDESYLGRIRGEATNESGVACCRLSGFCHQAPNGEPGLMPAPFEGCSAEKLMLELVTPSWLAPLLSRFRI